MGEAFIKRSHDVLGIYNMVVGRPFEMVLVCDTLNAENKREYNSMWIVGKDFLSECKAFLIADVVDFARCDLICYFEINKVDFEPGKAKESSRLRLEMSFKGRENEHIVGGDLRATGVNCERLWKFFQEYVANRA
jgi:hypothetical protein